MTLHQTCDNCGSELETTSSIHIRNDTNLKSADLCDDCADIADVQEAIAKVTGGDA